MGHRATAILGRFTAHRDELGELFRAEVPRRTGPGGIVKDRFNPAEQSLVRIASGFGCIQSLGTCAPALPPRPHGGTVKAELMGNRLIVGAISRSQNRVDPTHEPLRARLASLQAL
jgi:hypothetical protein